MTNKKPLRPKRKPVIPPTSVEILGVHYSIKLVPDYLSSPNIGLCLYAQQEIQVFEEAKEEARKKTLLHEALHAIIFEGGCYGKLDEKESDESVVQGIANGMYQLIRNNPQLISYLMERK